MAEYFEREALEKRLNERLTYLLDKNGPYDHYTDGYDEAVNTVEEFPAADVVPVVHWVSANEDLPPNGQYVLCWYEYFRYGEYNRMYQTFGIGYQFHGIWGGEVARGSKTRVLAWMPLPNPPEMDGGADHAAD